MLTTKPIGIMPRAIHRDKRRKEIQDACDRYIQAGYKIPADWFLELCELGVH